MLIGLRVTVNHASDLFWDVGEDETEDENATGCKLPDEFEIPAQYNNKIINKAMTCTVYCHSSRYTKLMMTKLQIQNL